MKKSMATQKNSSIFETAVKKANSTIFGSGVNVGLAGKEINKKRMQTGTVRTVAPEFDANRKNLGKAPTKQMAPIDPVTGMPMQPQMTPQPNTVGMPGTMPMPAGMGHTLPEHGMQAGGRKMSPYMQKKKTSVAGQDISESGHMNVNYKDGPKEGDLIRGPHLKYDNVGLPEDFDYKVKFEKDTVDQHGPYKIYKTIGIK